jgi:hypothetical protein
MFSIEFINVAKLPFFTLKNNNTANTEIHRVYKNFFNINPTLADLP